MTYKISCLFIIVFHAISLGQDTYSDIVKPRHSFVSNNAEATDFSKFVILDTDTLYAKYDTHDLSFLNDSTDSLKNFIRDYQTSIFQYTNENSKNSLLLKQWNTPIVVYLHKDLPKKVRKDFERFYSQIEGIDNFSISFTKDIDKANYYIKVVDTPLNAYNDDYEFDDEEGKNKSIFSGVTYKLLTDNNAKFFSGILDINVGTRDDFNLLKQLKQIFFFSLGQFTIRYYYEHENSLRSYTYNNSETFSEIDLELLRFHYKIIYERKINGTTFKKLNALAKDKI